MFWSILARMMVPRNIREDDDDEGYSSKNATNVTLRSPVPPSTPHDTESEDHKCKGLAAQCPRWQEHAESFNELLKRDSSISKR